VHRTHDRYFQVWTTLPICLVLLCACAAEAQGAQRHGPANPNTGRSDKAQAALPEPPKVATVAKVALMRLSGLGLSEGVRRNLEALVLTHLRGLPHHVLVEPAVRDVALARPEYAALQRCDDGPPCQRRRGAVLEADVVVYGTIAALGNDYSLTLRALRVGDGVELGRQRATLSGNLDLLIPQMRVATYRLLAPEALWGSVMVDTAIAGIQVQIDGRRLPTTPWSAAVDHLTPGVHHVHFDGLSLAHGDIDVVVQPFETTQIQVELGRKPHAAVSPDPVAAPALGSGVPPAPAAMPLTPAAQ
jgi:hypothetical protein